MTKSKRTTSRKSRGRAAWRLPVLAGLALLGAVALLAWAGSARLALNASGGTPSLKANQEKVDLGDVRLGQTVAVAFELTNTGDAPLRFSAAPYVEVVEGC